MPLTAAFPAQGSTSWYSYMSDLDNVVRTQASSPMTGVYDPMSFGAIGSVTSNPLSTRYATLSAAQAVYPFVTSLTQEIDGAAVQAAANAAKAAGGGVVWIGRPYAFNQRITILQHVNVRGCGAGEGSDAELRATGAAAQLMWGDGSTGEVRGGLSGGFIVNGNGVGGTSTGGLWYENRVTQRAFVDTTVEDSAGDGRVMHWGQNNFYAHCDTHRSIGNGRTWDFGTGGHLVLRAETSKSKGYGDFFNNGAGGPYPVPTHITIMHSLNERGHDSTSTTNGLIRSVDSERVLYINCIFAVGAGQSVTGADSMIQVLGGDLIFDTCTLSGTSTFNGFRQEAGRITLLGKHHWRGMVTAWTRNGGSANLMAVEQTLGTMTRWAGTVGATGAVQVATTTL